MTVGLVLVAHVVELALGVRTLATQMAPDVPIVAAGGTDEGGVGTSFAKVEAGITDLLAGAAGAGVVVLYDLGSAQMTADMVRDTLDPPQAGRVRVVDAPLVEGALAAATTAAGGGTLAQVVEAAESAAGADAQRSAGTNETATPGPARVAVRTVLRNPAGLHARPASHLARLAGGFDATVEVGRPGRAGVDASSVLGVVAQGLRVGDEVEFVVAGPQAQATLDAILSAVAEGFGELAETPSDTGPSGLSSARPSEPPPEVRPRRTPDLAALDLASRSDDRPEGVHRGIVASPGLAIGPVRHLRRVEPTLPTGDAAATTDPDAERARFEAALAQVDADLAHRARGDGPAAEIAAAHQAMLADPALRRDVLDRIAAGTSAEHAWWAAVRQARDVFAAADAYVAERAADVEDLGRAVLRALGVEVEPTRPPEDLAGAVVVADDVLPSDVTRLAEAGTAGVALARGGPTAHASIIARGLELPLAVGFGGSVLDLAEESEVVLDGYAGTLQVDPPPTLRDAARTRERQRADERAHARTAARALAISYEGRRVRVMANIASAAEARAAVAQGADGVGLLRTELMYGNRATVPDEDEQVGELTTILRVLKGLPVVVRTLDVGGDKLLPALTLDPIRHGPLGERGLRHGLRHLDLLRTQLRAVLRVAAYEGTGQVSVMAPMVTVPDEARAFRQLVADVAEDLAAEGRTYARPAKVGVMVEVPAAALTAAEIGAEVDFVSIGSNDLAQYLLAADRTNAAVGHLYRQDHPAMWRMIELLTADAKRAGCEVAVCGELAGDPRAATRLVTLGVDELSMAPASVPAVKQALHQALGG
jgi:multiphosphoryl transfer protein